MTYHVVYNTTNASFMTYHVVYNTTNAMSTASGADTAYLFARTSSPHPRFLVMSVLINI